MRSVEVAVVTRTSEQKQCPQVRTTGASYSSWQILQRSALSSALRPGAVDDGGKSVGSCMSMSQSSSLGLFLYIVLRAGSTSRVERLGCVTVGRSRSVSIIVT